MILFLDFDGVLHPSVCYENDRLMGRLPLLEAVLRDFPAVQIVISSTWREGRPLHVLQGFFSEDIANRIIGVTPKWKDVQSEEEWGTYVRQGEIEAWLSLEKRGWEPWVALDDKPYLFRPFLKNLVKTDPAVGLTEVSCEDLRRKLEKG